MVQGEVVEEDDGGGRGKQPQRPKDAKQLKLYEEMERKWVAAVGGVSSSLLGLVGEAEDLATFDVRTGLLLRGVFLFGLSEVFMQKDVFFWLCIDLFSGKLSNSMNESNNPSNLTEKAAHQPGVCNREGGPGERLGSRRHRPRQGRARVQGIPVCRPPAG